MKKLHPLKLLRSFLHVIKFVEGAELAPSILSPKTKKFFSIVISFYAAFHPSC